MESATVGLHHEAEVGPEEVDLEAVDVHARKGLGEPGAAGNPQEDALELRAGEGERAAVDGGAEPGDTWAVWGVVERSAEVFEPTSFRRSASLSAASSSLRGRRAAMSMRVQVGVVTGMPWRLERSAAVREARRWTRMPGWRRLTWAGTTSSSDRRIGLKPHSAAAESWLIAASGPHARTAAMREPRRLNSGRPTA
jgi:hypothetical protein